MLRIPTLSRIVPWAQQLVGEALQPGDLAVDLTAGTGRDTLSLWQRVAPDGRVLAFDIQAAALEQTAQRLREAGAPMHLPWSGVLTDKSLPGVYLVQACHAEIDCYLETEPKAVIANLGYLPGGDTLHVTAPETTRSALGRSLDLLPGGGRLAVVVYHGHPGGQEEASVVESVFAGLPPSGWQTLRLQVANRPAAPYLLVAERQGW